jgi:hypothetical protein
LAEPSQDRAAKFLGHVARVSRTEHSHSHTTESLPSGSNLVIRATHVVSLITGSIAFDTRIKIHCISEFTSLAIKSRGGVVRTYYAHRADFTVWP